MYRKEVLHQLSVAIESSINMLEQAPDDLLDWKPAENKRSVRELFVHLALLCKADYFIMEGHSQKYMKEFYLQAQPHTKQEIKECMSDSFHFLSEVSAKFTETELNEQKASYWGTVYSRFEWLLQILSHFYHHRAQIHSFLVINGCILDVKLFE